MKRVIVLKGNPNSGKSTILREKLPILLGNQINRRKIFYKEKWILIIRCSLHESKDWKSIIKKIKDNNGYDIIVIASWSDECVGFSIRTQETLEEIFERNGILKINYNVVNTTSETEYENQLQDNARCAQEIFNYIQLIV